MAELRQALNMPAGTADDAESRGHELEHCTAALCRAPELRDALLLRDWRVTDADERVAVMDQKAHTELMRRFEQVVSDVLGRGTMVDQLAVLNLVGDMAGALRHMPSCRVSLRGLTCPLADATICGKPAVAVAAARTLGVIDAEATVAIPALAKMLDAENVALRRAAMEACVAMLCVSDLGIQPRVGDARASARLELLRRAQLIARFACEHSRDRDVAVRRGSVEALRWAAVALRQAVSRPTVAARVPREPDNEIRAGNDTNHAAIVALCREFQRLAADLSLALEDSDVAVRLAASQAFEEVGTAAQILGQHREARDGKEICFTPLVPALPLLCRNVRDVDPRVRRTAIEALETLGHEGASAMPALLDAFRDTDIYVRWAAARAAGRIGPVDGMDIVPSLTHLLNDADMGVRLAAIGSLSDFGPEARQAVPALDRLLQCGDGTMRLAALKTLERMGPGDEHPVGGVVAALEAPEPSIRKAAADVLGRLGPQAQPARDPLQVLLLDANVDVRKAAGDALLFIGPPPADKKLFAVQSIGPRTVPDAPVIWRASYSEPASTPVKAVTPAPPIPHSLAPEVTAPAVLLESKPVGHILMPPTVWHTTPQPENHCPAHLLAPVAARLGLEVARNP